MEDSDRRLEMDDNKRSKFSRTQHLKAPREHKAKEKFGATGFDNIQIFESKHKQTRKESGEEEDLHVPNKESSRKKNKVQEDEEEEND